jgi:hypothetical protein
MPEMGTHGTGGIYARKNGLFEVRITFEGGRRISRYARDRKAAERLQRELVDAREADLDPSRLTLEVFLRSWIDGLRSARNQRLAPKTLAHYTQIVEHHIIPALGKFRLDRLRSTTSRRGSTRRGIPAIGPPSPGGPAPRRSTSRSAGA